MPRSRARTTRPSDSVRLARGLDRAALLRRPTPGAQDAELPAARTRLTVEAAARGDAGDALADVEADGAARRHMARDGGRGVAVLRDVAHAAVLDGNDVVVALVADAGVGDHADGPAAVIHRRGVRRRPHSATLDAMAIAIALIPFAPGFADAGASGMTRSRRAADRIVIVMDGLAPHELPRSRRDIISCGGDYMPGRS